jgi:O-antigen/teichoic acid export membrane protein
MRGVGGLGGGAGAAWKRNVMAVDEVAMVSRPKLGRRLAANTGAALVDLILNKVTNTIVFIVLVRVLGTDQIAAIGVAMGYLVLVAYLDISPIRILLRDYPKYQHDDRGRNRLLTALLVFWMGQAVAILMLAGAIAALLMSRHDLPDMGLLFVAMACDYLAMSLGTWIKTVFYSGLRQGIATVMSLVIAAARLLAFGLLFLRPTLNTYSIVLIVMAAAACIAWLIFFVVVFHYRPIIDRHSLGSLWHCLTDYGAWDHLNTMAIDTLFLIDTVILSWIVMSRPDAHQQIADYSIALRFTSLLFLIPMQLRRGLQVAIANSPDRRRQVEAVNMVIKFSAMVAMAQLLGVWVVGESLLGILFGAGSNANVVLYTRLITVGITILAITLPLLSVVSNLSSLRRAFFQVFLPVLIVGLAVYVAATLLGGAAWLAGANIVVYACMAIGLMVFTVRNCPFPLRVTWLSPREKAAFEQVLRRRPREPVEAEETV